MSQSYVFIEYVCTNIIHRLRSRACIMHAAT